MGINITNQNVTINSWKPISFFKDKLKIKLNFSDPILISQEKIRDKMIVEFKNASIFDAGIYNLSSDSIIL